MTSPLAFFFAVAAGFCLCFVWCRVSTGGVHTSRTVVSYVARVVVAGVYAPVGLTRVRGMIG